VAKRADRRWRDWRIDETSGRSIRPDDKRGRPERRKKREARSGWWWTLAVREAECGTCGKQLVRQKIAYHHQTKQILCPECAQAECISELCQPSRKLLEVGS
jgi:hypothetical protein